jgi:hypothetical protein
VGTVSRDEDVASEGCNTKYATGYIQDRLARVLHREKLGRRFDFQCWTERSVYESGQSPGRRGRWLRMSQRKLGFIIP